MTKLPGTYDFVSYVEPDPQPGTQVLASEAAVAISFNGINHAVMMATPCDLEDFAIGFSLCNGIATSAHQVLDVETAFVENAVTLDITLNQRAMQQFRQARRALAGTSGCGLCGVEALEQALAPPGAAVGAPGSLYPQRQTPAALPALAHLRELRQRFRESQQQRCSRGAMHAALFVDGDGNTRACREDIGRHNALDKLLGACARESIGLEGGFVAITSRCSLELVQKAVRAGVSTLVSLASPSDLCVRWAQQYHLNLIHMTSQDSPRVYSPAPVEAKRLMASNVKEGP
ncbi:formate dehydrogenase accessory sulfurtransferase FdhD [uncultured Microbulbifer sp.]|uniref:formate dehydrogenase accessory sulfurtransferase FdhD n=1 Tax=uncultured Microbulbifer sp. TaxID=348147 RepID=UPI0025EB51C0|nr:formate dehydrogenase accessory sulfurtransferase FdhD [uncultured Microbulbifer sp.]